MRQITLNLMTGSNIRVVMDDTEVTKLRRQLSQTPLQSADMADFTGEDGVEHLIRLAAICHVESSPEVNSQAEVLRGRPRRTG